MSTSKKGTYEVSIPEFRPEDMPLSCSWIVVGPPGSGKCLAKNTPVMMFDGSIKNVQDIKTGELIMGDDSTPREILSTCKGKEILYEITQISKVSTTSSTPETYTVNESHILSLKNNLGKTEDIPLLDFIKNEEKHEYHGYKAGIDFIGQKVPIDPYLFGLWVPHATPYEIKFNDINDHNRHEKENIVREAIKNYGFDIVKRQAHGDTVCFNSTSKIDTPYVAGYQHSKPSVIPEEYIKNSRTIRLNFLAGLIDCIGCLASDGSFEMHLTEENRRLFDDIIYLVKSLGLFCNYYGKTSINIYGDVLSVPVRILRNKPLHNHSEHICGYSLSVEKLEEGKYYGFQIDGNHRFLLGDFTVTHNTTFMENMAYYKKHVYAVGRVFMGTEDGYKRFSKIFHPLYVSNYWDEDEESRHVVRQKTCEMENGRGYPGNYAVNIIDDVSDDPKIYKTKLMRGLFKLGSQHYAQLLMIGSQYAIDMPPDIRKAVSYVAIGREPEEIERKKLYENFGGLAGSYNKFCDLMDQITGDYTFLIFKKRSQSNDLQECVSWFKTKQLGDWKFGCKEYRAHGEERYDKNYVEQITI